MTEYATATTIDNEIAAVINASTAGFGSAITKQIYSAGAITAARRGATAEVFRAIALNPQCGHYGAIVELVAVVHGDQLPDHIGEPGIPMIVPFDGATAEEGYPADPDEIDDYRKATADFPIYAGALGAESFVAHDQPDQFGQPSRLSGQYSLDYGKLKFTGLSCQVPLILVDEELLDTLVTLDMVPIVVNLAIPKLVKEGDTLYQIAGQRYQMGRADLQELVTGTIKQKPNPAPNVVESQQAII